MALRKHAAGRRPPDLEQVMQGVAEGRFGAGEAMRRLRLGTAPQSGSAAAGGKGATAAQRRLDSPAEAEQAGLPPVPLALRQLERLNGLASVKRVVHEVYAFIQVQERRRAAGLKCEPVVLHMVMKGNPGTGKTTVARIVGRLFHEMGLLPRGHMVEVERADLVGEFIGHTAQKTREQIKRAMGGVLFIDEAYSLARGGDKDFGREAIDTLVKAMEDHKHELVVILAGYSDEMDWFLAQNPGLPSRFPIQIAFPDYTVDELLAIADQMCDERDYRLAQEARATLGRRLLKLRLDSHFGNARTVRNLLEQAIRRQALRLVGQPQASRDDLITLQAVDLQEEGAAMCVTA